MNEMQTSKQHYVPLVSRNALRMMAKAGAVLVAKDPLKLYVELIGQLPLSVEKI